MARVFGLLYLVSILSPVHGYELPLPPEHHLRRQERREFMLRPSSWLPLTHRETLAGQRDGDPQILFEFYRGTDNDYVFLWTPRGPTGFDPTRRGAWMFRFQGRLNVLQEVRIYLGEGPHTYLLLRPEQQRFRAEAFLEGERIASRVPVLVNQERLVGLSLRELVELTRAHIDWSLFFVDDGNLGALSRDFALTAERLLGPAFPEQEDGALDERGVWRRIATGQEFSPGGFNCSGLAKWFVDALAFAVGRRYLPLDERLLEKPLEVRGNAYTASLEDLRDPYFGLDWTRALLRELVRLADPSQDPEWTRFDVTDYPWTRYVPNRGYPVDKLPAIAQWLAANRPARLFLLSVNGDYRPEPSAPVLLQHRHVAVLLVWSQEGVVRHALFETDGSGARRTSIPSLLRRYPQHFVHVVETPLLRGYRFPVLRREVEVP